MSYIFRKFNSKALSILSIFRLFHTDLKLKIINNTSKIWWGPNFYIFYFSIFILDTAIDFYEPVKDNKIYGAVAVLNYLTQTRLSEPHQAFWFITYNLKQKVDG